MNLANDLIPRGGSLDDARPPAERKLDDGLQQAPLGGNPSYDDVLDTAVDYTFPCSDPVAAGACCRK